MSAAANPDIVTDGLVFKYDTGDGKSYRGEPTTNLISGVANPTLSTSGWYSTGWNGSISTDTDEGALVLNATNGWRSMSYDFGVTNGTVTVQFDYKLKSAEHTNIYMIVLNGTHLGSYTQYLDGNLYPSLSEYKTYKKTFNTTTDSKICIVLRGTDNAGLTDEMFIKNLQVEAKSHATPFVNGTRSATQGLLDRTGNSTIDLSDVSFDSNAQMVFDGTDDHIELTSNGFGEFNFQTWTVESWVKFDTISGDRVIFSYDYTSHSQPYYSTHLRTNGVGKLFLMWNDGTQYRFLSTSNNAVSSGQWYHLVGVYESGRQQIFLNGESLVSSTRTDTITFYNQEVWIGRANYSAYHDGDIKVLRHYNKALTAAEVLQNYNATKSRFGL